MTLSQSKSETMTTTPSFDFYITGLPRTRSAWLSVLFTYKDVFCFHEAEKYENRRKERLVGNCSSAIPFNDVPAGRPLVIIKRDFRYVKKSIAKIYDGDVTDRLKMCQNLLEGLENQPHLAVDYKDLDDMDTLQQMWQYVTGRPFDPDRAKMLTRMKIEIHQEKELAFLASLR